MPQPKSSTGFRLGIVNPLTLVGNEIKTILRERAFPFAKVSLLDSTGKAAGALTEVNDEPAVVTPISDDELEDLAVGLCRHTRLFGLRIRFCSRGERLGARGVGRHAQ